MRKPRKKKTPLLKRATQAIRFPGLLAMPPRVQYGALPWRMRDGTLEVMLVTSRGTGRWIIPKGWPHEGFSSAQSAAQEAFEEAGITGAITDEPVGDYTYMKVRNEGGEVECVVHVHALEVAEQRPDWPEKAERETRWHSRQAASELVVEPELRELILTFAPDLPYN